MVDDMGYRDPGCFGQKVLQTPNMDRMAAEGLLMTQFYAGSPVCAPSRSTLMTGLHTGHTTVRGNKSSIPLDLPNPERVPLLEEDLTVAEVLKEAGYVTGMAGKWGLGEAMTTGEPNSQGFDHWLGFLNQRRAHNHYAPYIWKDRDTLWLNGNDDSFGAPNVTFSHNLFTGFALDFIERYRDTAFFLYLPWCLPHDHLHIPSNDLKAFQDREWTEQEKVYAAMIRRIDMDLGQILDLVEELQLAGQTLVFFCSDNGAARRWEGRFDSSGALRGRKRDMYEGGIRTPMLVWMPGTIPAGSRSSYPAYFPDLLPTLSEVAGMDVPEGLDGHSLWTELRHQDQERTERFMYWEFHEGGFYQAVRWKNWKAVRQGLKEKLELYDLETDPSETEDVAASNPAVVANLEAYLAGARSKSPYWKAY